MTTEPTTPAEINERLRDAILKRIGALTIAIIGTTPGAARKPIYREIRFYEKLLAQGYALELFMPRRTE